MELPRAWWNALDPSWVRFFKIRINPAFSSNKTARDGFTPSDPELEALTKVEWLSVDAVSVHDLTPLKVFENLRTLMLRRLPNISSPAKIGELPKLRHLELESIPFLDSALTGFQSLEKLGLINNGLKNLTSIKHLTRLTNLRIEDMTLENLDGVSGLNLEALHIKGGAITNLEAISNMTRLKSLTLENLPLESLNGIETLAELELLELSGSAVTSIAALGKLLKLKSLDLRENQVNDLRPLYTLAALENLRITGRNFTEDMIRAFKSRLPNCQIRTEYAEGIQELTPQDFEVNHYYGVTFDRQIGFEFKFLEVKTDGKFICEKRNGQIFDFSSLPEYLSVKEIYPEW